MSQTDTISYTCTACGHTADFPKAQEGKAVYCPKCQAAQVIKGPGTDRFPVERIPTGRIVKAEQAPATDRIEKPHGMAGTARIDFTCGACNHLSRISAALSGQPVRCPTCGTVQLAGVAGLRVVRIDGTGKLPFTCTACNYTAKLNPDYSGKAIRCPKCQGAQVVPRILRDPSGVYQAQPPAGEAPKQPGTGSHKRPATGQFSRPAEPPKRPTTGSFSKPAAPATAHSEPSSALRTPAGGIPVASPMAMPTPLPGSLATPPHGTLSTPPPEPTPSPSSASLPPVPSDGDDLDLGDTPAANAGDAPAEAARPRGGSVVRRSGRIATQQRTPKPGDEPTLEPARAVQPEPESESEPAAEAESKTPAPAPLPKTPVPSRTAQATPASPSSRAQPAWLVPALGVGLAVAAIAAIILLVMLNAESDRASGLSKQVESEHKRAEAAIAESATLKQKLGESETARQQAASERDEQRGKLDALRRDFEALDAESKRLKAEAERLKTESERLKADNDRLKTEAAKPATPPVGDKPAKPAPPGDKPAAKPSTPPANGQPERK